jgi:hypothetical protein
MHPDPAGLAAVDITNPQSWNRYAYVNNPLGNVDPLGLSDCPAEEPDCRLPPCDFDSCVIAPPPDPIPPVNPPGYPPPCDNCGPSNPPPTGPGNSGTPPNKKGIAVAAPPTDPCQQQAQNIQDLRNEILGRFQDYSNNALPLPLLGSMSRAGHIQQIGNKQQALRNALNDYRSSGCGGSSGNDGLPGDVNQVAFSPLPTLSPSRLTTRQVLTVGGIVVVGGAVVVLIPELLPAIPEFLPGFAWAF